MSAASTFKKKKKSENQFVHSLYGNKVYLLMSWKC